LPHHARAMPLFLADRGPGGAENANFFGMGGIADDYTLSYSHGSRASIGLQYVSLRYAKVIFSYFGTRLARLSLKKLQESPYGH